MQLTKFLIGTAVVLATVTSPVAAKKKDKDAASAAPKSTFNKDPYPSTYQPYASVPTAVTNVIVYDGEGAKFQNARFQAHLSNKFEDWDRHGHGQGPMW